MTAPLQFRSPLSRSDSLNQPRKERIPRPPPVTPDQASKSREPITLRPNGTIAEYLVACPMIVRISSAEDWVELRCYMCYGNCDPHRGSFLKGVVGLQRHILRFHDIKPTLAIVMEKGRYRNLTTEEVLQVEDGEVIVDSIKCQAAGKSAAPEGESVAELSGEHPVENVKGQSTENPDEPFAHTSSPEAEAEVRTNTETTQRRSGSSVFPNVRHKSPRRRKLTAPAIEATVPESIEAHEGDDFVGYISMSTPKKRPARTSLAEKEERVKRFREHQEIQFSPTKNE